MKLDKKLAKIIEENGQYEVFKVLTNQTGIVELLLQVSNRLCHIASQDKAQSKLWLKRAKAVHNIMTEIENETKETV